MMHMPDEWTEVNLVPHSRDDGIKVLLEVIDPLVHDKLSGRIDSWHYGQYDEPAPFHLRLRVHWQEPEQSAESRSAVSDFLEVKKNEGILQDHYEGSHGEKNMTYPDESSTFKEIWEATYRFWEGQSEFALALLKREYDGSLSEDLTSHWESTVHLFSNRMGLSQPDEVYLALQRARSYIDPQKPAALEIIKIQGGIGVKRILTKSVQERFKKDFGIP
jgi:hypothetical protein